MTAGWLTIAIFTGLFVAYAAGFLTCALLSMGSQEPHEPPAVEPGRLPGESLFHD
jgi:hypothetical protein